MLSLALPTFRGQLTFHRDYCCGTVGFCAIVWCRGGHWGCVGASRFFFLVLNCKCEPIAKRPKQFRWFAFLLARLLLRVHLSTLEITKSARLTKPPRSAQILEGASFDDEQVLRRAHKQVLHWGAASWVGSQNKNATTPSTIALIAQLELMRLAIPERLRPRSWRICVPGALRAKASRLRAKYGGRIGHLQVRGEYVTTRTP